MNADVIWLEIMENPYESPTTSETTLTERASLEINKWWRTIGLFALPTGMLVTYITKNLAFIYVVNPFLFLLTLISISILLRNNDWKFATCIGFVVAIAVLVSFAPFWFRHSALVPGGSEIHWHNYWNMGHVH